VCDEKRFCKSISGALEQVRNGVGDGLFTAYHGEHNWAVAHRVLVPAFGPLGIKDMFDGMCISYDLEQYSGISCPDSRDKLEGTFPVTASRR
jgi:hypothetical protein